MGNETHRRGTLPPNTGTSAARSTNRGVGAAIARQGRGKGRDAATRAKISATLRELRLDEDTRYGLLSEIVAREIGSTNDLTDDEAWRVADALDGGLMLVEVLVQAGLVVWK